MAITEADIEQATERAQRHHMRAQSAHFDREENALVVRFRNGAELRVPAGLVECIAEADPAALEAVEISPAGLGIYFPGVDADIYVPGLLEGVFGSKAWMASERARQAGQVRSEAKAAAARENGRRGGRPKKNVVVESEKTRRVWGNLVGPERDPFGKQHSIVEINGVKMVVLRNAKDQKFKIGDIEKFKLETNVPTPRNNRWVLLGTASVSKAKFYGNG